MFKINNNNTLKQIINFIFILICFFCFIFSIILYYKLKKLDQKIEKTISSSQSLIDSNAKHPLEGFLGILEKKSKSLDNFCELIDDSNHKVKLKKTNDELKALIEESKQILKDNEEDKKTSSILELAQNIFQQKIRESENSEDKFNYEQLLKLIEKFKKSLIFRDQVKKNIEEQQIVLNGSPSKNHSLIPFDIGNEKETLKEARIYLNDYANIISLFLVEQEEINKILTSKQISPSEENLLKQIENILTKDLTKTLLGIMSSKRSNKTNKILAQLN